MELMMKLVGVIFLLSLCISGIALAADPKSAGPTAIEKLAKIQPAANDCKTLEGDFSTLVPKGKDPAKATIPADKVEWALGRIKSQKFLEEDISEIVINGIKENPEKAFMAIGRLFKNECTLVIFHFFQTLIKTAPAVDRKKISLALSTWFAQPQTPTLAGASVRYGLIEIAALIAER